MECKPKVEEYSVKEENEEFLFLDHKPPSYDLTNSDFVDPQPGVSGTEATCFGYSVKTEDQELLLPNPQPPIIDLTNSDSEEPQPGVSGTQATGAGAKRKKSQEKKKWSRPQILLTLPTCRHAENSVLKCKNLTMYQIQRFQRAYACALTDVEQEDLLKEYVSAGLKRTCVPSNRPWEPTCTHMSLKYFVPGLDDKSEKTRVCRLTFLSVLGISDYKLRKIFRPIVDNLIDFRFDIPTVPPV